MEEQMTPAPARSRNRTIPFVVVLVLMAAAGFAAYLLIAARFGAPVDPATYVPKNVALALTIDLTSTSEKDAATRIVRGILKDAGSENPEDGLFEDINKQFKIDVKRDVLAHLSGVGAFAVLAEMTGTMPQMVAIIGTRSDKDSAAIMTTLGNKLNDNRVGFSRKDYSGYYYYYVPADTPRGYRERGFPIQQIPMQQSHYIGAVKKGIVYSNSESAFKKVVDTATGQPSLAQDERFQTLRKTGGSTFASVYYSGAGYYKLVAPAFKMAAGQMGPGAADTLKRSIENNVAAVGNFDASADGISFHLKGSTKMPNPAVVTADVKELASIAPRDAALVFAVAGWDKAWREFRMQVDSNPELSGQFDQAASQIKQFVGVDLYGDFLDRITALGGYYTPARPCAPNGFPGDFTLVLSVDKPAVVGKSLAKIHAAIAGFGMVAMKPAKVSGVGANLFPLGPGGGVFGDAIVGDKLVLSFGGSASTNGLRSAVMASQGKAQSITSNQSFRTVARHLPGKSTGLFYGDAGPIVSVFKNEIPLKDRKVVESVTGKIGAFGVTASSAGTEYDVRAIVPFGTGESEVASSR
ncbi:MAG: DUF3352 domain-containing protein [Armatimonadota bacterium]